MVFALAFAVGSIVLNYLIGEKTYSKVKGQPYECGMNPIRSAWERFSVKFYLIAILFLVFDLEVVFFYPFALVFRKFGIPLLIEMGVFICILLVGYIYAWRKGALEWVSKVISPPTS